MTIVFAEDFRQEGRTGAADSGISIIHRYPGSYVLPDITMPESGFPINRGAWLVIPEVPFKVDSNRLEVYMETEPSALSGVTSELNVFGILINVASTLTVDGVTIPDLSGSSSINFIVERSPKTGSLNLIVLSDGEVVVTPTPISNFSPNAYMGPGPSASPSNALYRGLPNVLKSIVVAVDTPVGTRISSPEFTKRSLEVVETGDWSFTDQGYVQDTDKTDPWAAEPRIQTADPSVIEFQVAGDPEAFTNLYISGGSEEPETSFRVNGKAYVPGADVRPVAINHASSSVIVETYLEAGRTNSDGLRFLGERADLISYADLFSAVGISQGSVMAGDAWFHVILDGKELLVPKTPVAQSVSYAHLYSLGLVYGTDDYGLFPVGTPVNQLHTVDVGGKTWKVRLMSGTDLDPTFGINNNNRIGTFRSEWSRIMYPLSGFGQRYGSALANYSITELGLERHHAIWMKDVRAPNRVAVGSSNSDGSELLQNRVSLDPMAAGGLLGRPIRWRPVLERI